MAENEVKNNQKVWYLFWALIIVGALVATQQASLPKGLRIEWRRVAMDGHRAGAKPITATNLSESLGTFTDSTYVTPSGVCFPLASEVGKTASQMKEAQATLAPLKVVRTCLLAICLPMR